jgi:hypothetical protein
VPHDRQSSVHAKLTSGRTLRIQETPNTFVSSLGKLCLLIPVAIRGGPAENVLFDISEK